ncbi:uncharacterized protein BYT42DRAFT_619003 [Radiomyces spectabilis]|uniref:uncharacterized protein n=1 Tax=Radiomyces spectabilis TaxID=64574 RepID=UPI00221EC6EE|nr:uncharacterized protein BYT42DRAFT_619003 [Radiomyces spectabilis]KAI8364169.1 hypothetical protein BYT42DRAFT_619003 [Radiomyces spectabilis]
MSGQPLTVTTARLTPKKRRNEDTNSDAQKIERLEAKVRGLERKIVKLEWESAERKQVAPVTTTDLDLNERVRKHYEYLGEQKQLFWDLEAGFNRSRNPDVAKALIGFIEQLPDEIRKPSWTPRVKRDERQAAFYVAGAVIPSHFPGAEVLLQTGLMSDEEDIIEGSCLVGRRVLRPIWRSDKANAFLDELSAFAQQRKKSKRLGRAPLPKEYVAAEVSPRPALWAMLPQEAKKQ